MNKFLLAVSVIAIAMSSCNSDQKKNEEATINKDSIVTQEQSIKEENVEYSGDGITMKGFAAYHEKDSLLPVVLIVHEWWGIGDYTKKRARELAALGYLAFSVDMYGDGKTAETPDEAQKLSAPFYGTLKTAKARFEAALAKIKTFPNADTTKIAAIGYCFGGAMVLNMARAGEPLKAVVSFHGDLIGNPADKNLLKAKILVCHGEADQFVGPEQVTAFKKQMDSIGADYTFKSYPGATHAFTNPGATEKGKKFKLPIEYNAIADTASFHEMEAFFNKNLK